jgi:preprotein translocase subunit SecY
MFLMWLGEQITERGLGNGISILIFAVLRGLAQRHRWFAELGPHGLPWRFLLRSSSLLLVALVTYFVVFVERGQRKILVNYASARLATRCMVGSRRTCL